MTAYYNEIDPKAAAWLRELIKAGLIADGEVDERDIQDIRPADLHGFTQCHFFAGIGVWSYTLRCAGWPDDRPIWTASCPCQPFSAAGKGGGFADERHLWPAFHWLIEQCRPVVVVGEQVASKDGLAWLDLVQADLEGSGYASGAVDTCAAGFGAPHIRQRLYWSAFRLANADDARSQGWPLSAQRTGERTARSGGVAGELENSNGERLNGIGICLQLGRSRVDRLEASGRSEAGIMADADSFGAKRWTGDPAEARGLSESQRQPEHHADVSERSGANHDELGSVCRHGISGSGGWPGPTNGLWRDADWLFCRDGKWRPVESGTFPLAHGAPARVGRLRGYGNAIVAPQATAFIEAVAEILMDAPFLEAVA